ncbi:AsmA-like C-terminal region-containing protein [Bacteroidia bacterium]|nr:AsmA-like C-terminal region-containing protein [Bacteroidia bacterium]
MKQIIKIASVLFILFILVVANIVFYFHQNIKPILISEMNNTLAVEVAVEEITISGLRDFPNLGIKLAKVSVDESTPYYQEKLLVADELNLFVDVWKLYKGEYVIDKVVLRGGKLRIADLNYRTNYDITKPRTDGGTIVSFEIKDLKLVNCDVLYEHRPSKFKCNTYTPLSTIALKYIEKASNLSIVAELNKTDVVSGGEKYIVGKDLKINTEIAINPDEQIVTIAPSDLQIQEVKLKAEGTANYSETSAVDIQFSNTNTTAQSLFSILPAHFVSSLDNIDLNGDVVINGFFKGKTYGTNYPALGFDYALKKAIVGVKGQDLKLSGVDATGDLTIPSLGNLRGAKATCKLQSAATKNTTIIGNIEVANFEKPTIKWDGTAMLEAAFILGLIDSSAFDAKSGVASIDGKLTLTYDIQKGATVPNSLRYAGTILLENLSGTLKDPKIDVKNIDLNVSADNQKMVVKSAHFSYNNTTGTLKGYIEDYISLLNEKSNAELVGQLAVDNLTVNELYSAAAVKTSNSPMVSGDLLPIKLTLMTTLTNFRFNDFIANKMQGQLLSNRISIRMPKCEIDALGGNTIANIAIKKWGENHLVDINSDLKKINITELFKQFNNFEQSEITDKNLKGTLNGNIIAKIILDKNYEPILPKLYAKVNVVIDNGALLDYKPLAELSAFAKIDDLKNVKFKSLKNTIEIFDQTIFIPRMRIENNALNLEIEGTHTFDNYMQYSMSLSVAELLATKANWIARKAEKRVEKNKDGGLTAYIVMEGTPDKLKIRYDRSTVKKNVKEEAKKEKKKFIQALKGEGTLEEETSDTKNYDDVWDE